jgi:hypothetical protein
VFVALGIQHEICMHSVVACGLSGPIIFLGIFSQTVRFFFSKTLLNIKCVFWFSLHVLTETFLIFRITEQDIIINIHPVFMYSTRYSFGILTSLAYSQQIFEKVSDIKFCEYLSSGNRAVSCGRTDKETDMTKPIVTFRHFAYSPKEDKDAPICYSVSWFVYVYHLFTDKISWRLSTSNLRALPDISVPWQVNDFCCVASSG